MPLLCKDCAHFRKVWIALNDIPGCGVEEMVDFVDSERVYRRCSVMRADDGKCGPEGKLFVAKEST